MPLNDDQLRALGRIGVHFNELEFIMNNFAWGLINPNSRIGRIALEGENFDRMLGKLKNLAQEVLREDQERLRRIEQWAKSASDLQRRRNEVLHAQWGTGRTGEVVGITWLRKGVHKVGANSGNLNQLADDIEVSTRELMDIMRGLAQFPQIGSKQ
jgi:hypothetical protein